MPGASTRFQTRQEVDFVVVGSGAAGGVMAKELAAATSASWCSSRDRI